MSSFDDGDHVAVVDLGGDVAILGRHLREGSHHIKMSEPEVPAGVPRWVAQTLLGALQHSDACLRYSAHPKLLAIVASLNGEDFTPFNETIWIKHPRLGGAVSWHQDGWTHWDSPELDDGTHGFNTMMQLYGCDAANGLWVVPGTHSPVHDPALHANGHGAPSCQLPLPSHVCGIRSSHC